LEEDPDLIATVTLIPDAEEPITDEDSEDEEDTLGRGMNISHLGRGLLNQAAEFTVNDVEDTMPDVTVYNAEGEIERVMEDETMGVEEDSDNEGQENQDRRGEKRKRVTREVLQLSRIKNTERPWSEECVAEFGKKVPAFQPAPTRSKVPNDCFLPYDFLRLFLTPEFVSMISVKSKLYCLRKGGSEEKQSCLSEDNILASIGVMYITGYLCPSQKDLFWTERMDTQNLLARKAMSRNRYLDVLRYTYFTEAEDQDLEDSFWKVRPLFVHINEKAKELIEQPEWVCVDESMIRYFGPHPLKQRIADKPERYGYKVWCLCTSSGELLACQPYAGAKTFIADQGLGQGPNVVLGLCQQYGLRPGSKLSADNLFNNFDLCDHMAENGWGLVGTLRQNRVVNVPLPTKKEAAKHMKRGEMETIYSNNVCCTVWRDSQPVFVVSNFTGPDPVGTCKRFAGPGKGYANVPCPKMILEYNGSMGGVDLLNQTVKCYAISPRQHKWYWPIWTWFLNVQMVQAWRLYRRTLKRRHLEEREKEKEEDAELEAALMLFQQKERLRREREEERQKKRKEEKKKEEISLLDFTRECVELLVEKHGEARQSQLKVGRLSAGSSVALQFDFTRPHLIVFTEVNGRCKLCHNRSQFRCETCNVCLHPKCFKDFHTK